ncbi:cyclase family protein [bacterium]|nr:cyclase family protein [bacterium]
MKTIFQFNETEYSADLQSGVSIARLLEIENSDFQIENIKTQRVPFVEGDFTGDVSAGGSCNVDVLKINPHCATTHTETLLHILNRTQWTQSPLEDVSIASLNTPIFIACVLVTIKPVDSTRAKKGDESYRPTMGENDLVISADVLEAALDGLDFQTLEIESPFAIVVRTSSSEAWAFDSKPPVPYFTNEAMEFISQSACQHLLVDLPSVDRRDDDGVLSNHHLFWNVDPKQEGPLDDFRVDRTITEMVSVPATLTDGIYLLDLQLVPLDTDASLSRPVLIRATA